MKKILSGLLIAAVLVSMFSMSCKKRGSSSDDPKLNKPFDSTLVGPFFKSYPDLQKYKKDLVALYRNYNYRYIWFDKNNIAEYGNSLYSKVIAIEDDGISTVFPYQAKIDGLFDAEKQNALSNADAELMLTALYLFYVEKVYKGIATKTTTDIGWLLPRKKVSYTGLLNSIISDKELQPADSLVLYSQYYRLRDALKRYRLIGKNGGWKLIDIDPDKKTYKPGDSARAIQQVRERLFITGELGQNSKSSRYDPELLAAVLKYQAGNGSEPDSVISAAQIRAMNVTVDERIKTIVVNMERCRWLAPEVFSAKEFIFVNIPAYQLKMFRDGNTVLESPVVVGKALTKTVIFSGKMSRIVFSPYWNLPRSIIEDEVKPGMARNKRYLASHNMEWNHGEVRQKPGKNNSLGLVKFVFPNSNNIYFHDSPAKSLFDRESRAFSHGCVRVAKARELAITILKDDPKWTPATIDAAMNAGKESICTLTSKIPVYIGYFTAWADDTGLVHFYEDIYERDEQLAALLFYKD